MLSSLVYFILEEGFRARSLALRWIVEPDRGVERPVLTLEQCSRYLVCTSPLGVFFSSDSFARHHLCPTVKRVSLPGHIGEQDGESKRDPSSSSGRPCLGRVNGP